MADGKFKPTDHIKDVTYNKFQLRRHTKFGDTNLYEGAHSLERGGWGGQVQPNTLSSRRGGSITSVAKRLGGFF